MVSCLGRDRDVLKVFRYTMYSYVGVGMAFKKCTYLKGAKAFFNGKLIVCELPSPFFRKVKAIVDLIEYIN